MKLCYRAYRERAPPPSAMIDIDVVYEGELHCNAIHRPSRERLVTDAPVDNHGRGESFSPTDLVAAALGTCMATTMGIKKPNLKIAGARFNIRKSMSTTPPRKISLCPKATACSWWRWRCLSRSSKNSCPHS